MSIYLDDITRSNIRSGTTREFLTSYEWDFRFTKVPSDLNSAVFKQNFRLRAKSVIPPEEPVNQPAVITIRGHQFSQPGMTFHNGQASFIIQDFADVGIQKPLIQLNYDICDPETKAMNKNPKDYLFNFVIVRLDPTRKLVKVWKCKDCVLQFANVVEDMDESKNPIGQTSVSFSIDEYTLEFPDISTAITTYNMTHYDKYSTKSLEI